MSRHYKTLWKHVYPEKPLGEITSDHIQRRVDAALGGAIPRRTRGRRLRLAAVLTAAVVALGGAALALNQHPDLLSLFFKGDTAPIQSYVEDSPRSVTDGRFTLTLLSSVTDGRHTYLVIQVEAHTDEAKEVLFSDDFVNMDTYHFRSGGDYRRPSSWGGGEEARTESSRTFSLEADTDGTVGKLGLGLAVLSQGHHLDIPLSQDMGVVDLAPGEAVTASDGRAYTLESLSLTPMSLRLSFTFTGGGDIPQLNLFLLGRDGSLLTRSQMLARPSGRLTADGTDSPNPDLWRRTWASDYTLKTPLDLSTLKAVIVEDTAFPLDGSPPYPAEVDPALYLSYLPLGERIEGGGFSAPVTAICDRLGADWAQATDGSVTATYRGVTLTLTPGSDQVMADGEPHTLRFPAFLRDGELFVPYNTFDPWGVELNWTSNTGDHPDLWQLIP